MAEALLHVLDSDCEAERAVLGGKAASLERIRSLGLPTPPGFCLTTAAHRLYLGENGLCEEVETLQRELPTAASRTRIERLMFAAPIPARLREEIGCAIASLDCEGGTLRLAVRSSAVAEDGAGDSFAGQHETLLGVAPEAIEDAVRRCWASLWSERAVAYRSERGIAFNGDLMGVLVQPLLAPLASAVAFTRNPLSADPDEAAVCAVAGLGEPLVSGSADACTIIVDRPTLETISIEAAGEAPGPGAADGGIEIATPIDVAAAGALVDQALCIERAMATPVDVEAALLEEGWRFLQARPITAGPGASARTG
jgi:rifampicin phosphotransferase